MSDRLTKVISDHYRTGSVGECGSHHYSTNTGGRR